MIMWSMAHHDYVVYGAYKGMYSNARFQISRFDGSTCKS